MIMNLSFGKKRVTNVFDVLFDEESGEDKGLTMALDNEWKGMDVWHPFGLQ